MEKEEKKSCERKFFFRARVFCFTFISPTGVCHCHIRQLKFSKLFPFVFIFDRFFFFFRSLRARVSLRYVRNTPFFVVVVAQHSVDLMLMINGWFCFQSKKRKEGGCAAQNAPIHDEYHSFGWRELQFHNIFYFFIHSFSAAICHAIGTTIFLHVIYASFCFGHIYPPFWQGLECVCTMW